MSGIPSWARIGAKVVCVDDAVPPGFTKWVNKGALAKGAVYTIRRVGIDETYGHLAVWVDEIVRSVRAADVAEVGYHLYRFRPVKTIEDDIAAHFSALLDVREPVGA